MCKHCFLPLLLVFIMKCCDKCLALCLITIIASASFTCMRASPAHLYVPQLFTHCLPTITCVMLMSIAFFIFWLYFVLFSFFSVCLVVVLFDVFVLSCPVILPMDHNAEEKKLHKMYKFLTNTFNRM